MRYSAARKAAAEAGGSFVYVFIGAGAVVTDEWSGGALGLPGIASAHALALAAMVIAFRPVSGGHVNPAISLACAATGRIPWSAALMYVLAQLLGGVAAALTVAAVFPADVWLGARLGALQLRPELAPAQGVLLEAVLTFALVVAFLGAGAGRPGPGTAAGLAVGAVAALAMLVGGPVTGGSMNPARAFAVALAGGVWDHQLVYWAGPSMGGLAAGLFYRRLFRQPRRFAGQGQPAPKDGVAETDGA